MNPSEELADRYISGDFEGLSPSKGSRKIGSLENGNPSFDVLLRMLRSDKRSAQGAALYILYNRGGPFPPEIVQMLRELSSHGDGEIRRWAEACSD